MREFTMRYAVNDYLEASGANRPSIGGEETILAHRKIAANRRTKHGRVTSTARILCHARRRKRTLNRLAIDCIYALSKEELSKVTYLSTHLATRILTSYSKYNGMVTKMRVIKSGGVITAATSIIMRNECFR